MFAVLELVPVFLVLTLPITVPMSFLMACLLFLRPLLRRQRVPRIQLGG